MRDTVQQFPGKLLPAEDENRVAEASETPFKGEVDIKMPERSSAVRAEFCIWRNEIDIIRFQLDPASVMPHFRTRIGVVIETPEGKFEFKIPPGNRKIRPRVDLQRQEECMIFLKHGLSPFHV